MTQADIYSDHDTGGTRKLAAMIARHPSPLESTRLARLAIRYTMQVVAAHGAAE